jgi:hypothetical protein
MAAASSWPCPRRAGRPGRGRQARIVDGRGCLAQRGGREWRLPVLKAPRSSQHQRRLVKVLLELDEDQTGILQAFPDRPLPARGRCARGPRRYRQNLDCEHLGSWLEGGTSASARPPEPELAASLIALHLSLEHRAQALHHGRHLALAERPRGAFAREPRPVSFLEDGFDARRPCAFANKARLSGGDELATPLAVPLLGLRA